VARHAVCTVCGQAPAMTSPRALLDQQDDVDVVLDGGLQLQQAPSGLHDVVGLCSTVQDGRVQGAARPCVQCDGGSEAARARVTGDMLSLLARSRSRLNQAWACASPGQTRGSCCAQQRCPAWTAPRRTLHSAVSVVRQCDIHDQHGQLSRLSMPLAGASCTRPQVLVYVLLHASWAQAMLFMTRDQTHQSPGSM
jgi:hypothetical protein